MEIKDKVLNNMKKANKPLSAEQIAELSGFDRKEVDKALKDLKKDESIKSPKRCYW